MIYYFLYLRTSSVNVSLISVPLKNSNNSSPEYAWFSSLKLIFTVLRLKILTLDVELPLVEFYEDSNCSAIFLASSTRFLIISTLSASRSLFSHLPQAVTPHDYK